MRKSISVLGRRQFSTENAYSVSASIFNRAQVSIVVRADCVPERCPAIRGRCRFCAQRPLPSMITATCRGSRVKSSFSQRKASSAVMAPSGCDDATSRLLFGLLFSTEFRGRFPFAPQSYHTRQRARNDLASPCLISESTFSTAGQFSMKQLAERRVSHDQRKHDHRHRGNPRHPIEPARIDLIAHQVAPVNQNQYENHYHGQQKSV